jgi:diguanylate cyclase (GGDEF)-like protein
MSEQARPTARPGPRAPGAPPGDGSLRAFWRRVWEPPDPQLSHAGAAGELLAAKVRAVLVLLVLYFPFVHLLLDPRDRASQIGLGLIAVALGQTLVVYAVLRRQGSRYVFALASASSLLDVSLVSAALASPLAFGLADGAVAGERGVFGIYLLAIFATALRYDSRICALAGGAALVEYGVVARCIGHARWVDDVGRLVLLAASTVLAAALVVRVRELRRLTTRDPLTGVLTRGFFEERLAEEAGRLEHARRPVLCAMIDLDHFKRFNDTHGHAAGDAALRAIGGVLAVSFRASDIVARYGGEEFVVVIPEIPTELGLKRLERIRAAVSALTPVGAPLPPLSMSVGVALFPADGATLREALAAADRRLYEAKGAGRDRLVGP